jgi:hypothetical protein
MEPSATDYHFDSMANKEIVQLVESVLANHREDAKDPAALNDLVTILDIFTEAGWPEALNLVWRLDGFFGKKLGKYFKKSVSPKSAPLNLPNLPVGKISMLYFNPCCIGFFRGSYEYSRKKWF